jgi:hypothetical protein
MDSARLTTILTPLEGAENTGKIVTSLEMVDAGNSPAFLGVKLIDRLIVKHSITGDDLSFLTDVKQNFGRT